MEEIPDGAREFYVGDRVKIEGVIEEEAGGSGFVTIRLDKKEGGNLRVLKKRLTLVERALPSQPCYKDAMVTALVDGGMRAWRRTRAEWDDGKHGGSSSWVDQYGSRYTWREIVEFVRSRDGVLRHMVAEQIFPVEA